MISISSCKKVRVEIVENYTVKYKIVDSDIVGRLLNQRGLEYEIVEVN